MSSTLDLLVHGGEVVSPRGTVAADIGIADGRIAWIGAPRWAPPAARTVDASGLHVLPGVIDPHVHMTAGSAIEQFCLEQMPSMVAGGVTTCFHFSETFGSYLSALEYERAVINSQALLDVGFHAILMKDAHLEELAACHSQFGVMSYKMYFAGGEAELYPGTLSVNDGYLFDAFRRIAGLGPGTIAMAHCENWEIADVLTRELQASGRNDPAAWTDARPAFCEEDGMRRAIFLAGVAKCPLYIVHSSIGRVVELVATARGDGTDVVAETCPHYLTIHRDHPRALHAKYNPAVKSESDLEALWQGLRDGWVSTLGSDHIPMKTIGGRDIWETEGGVPGSGTILPVLLSEGVNKGRISLEKVAEVCSENTARVFGLAQKGRIAVGADADLVLVDLHKRLTVTPEVLHTDVTLFDGWEMTGWPVMTVLRGHVIFEDGEVKRERCIGRYVRDLRRDR